VNTRVKTDVDGYMVYGSNYKSFGPGYRGDGYEEFRYTGKHLHPSGFCFLFHECLKAPSVKLKVPRCLEWRC
jgi:hypothetical protein